MVLCTKMTISLQLVVSTTFLIIVRILNKKGIIITHICEAMFNTDAGVEGRSVVEGGF